MFWENFVKICSANNISPSAMVAQIGLSNSITTRWKNGSVPSDTTLSKISRFFGVTEEFLLGKEKTDRASPGYVDIPVVGAVAAGRPLLCVEDVSEYIPIPEKQARSGDYVALKISGDSMEPTIHDGDVVIVNRQEDVDNGEIAIVILGGEEGTCKIVEKNGDGIQLVPINKKYGRLIFTTDQLVPEAFRIYGKVTEVRHFF